MAPEVKSKHRHSRCRGIVQIKFDHKTNVQKKTKKMNDTEMRQHAIAITGITDEDFDKALERVKLDPEPDKLTPAELQAMRYQRDRGRR